MATEGKTMKAKQRLIPIWLLCAAMLPAVAQAQFTYTTNNGAITITSYTGLGGVLTIPSAINGQPVANIGTNVFFGCSGLNCIIIPSSVTNIGSHAFSGCTNLISVFLGGNVPSADSTVFTDDNNAFAYCLPGTTGWGSKFTGIQTVLPPYNYSVTNGAITLTSYAGSEATLTIPGMIGGLPVISIAASAFQNRALTSVTIPDSVTNIGSDAFSVCTNLACATIGEGLTSIPPRAFFHCGSLANVTIGKGVLSINDSAFESCGLTSVTIPSGVTTIGNYAFSSCLSLTNVAIGNGVTSIGTEAFVGCYGLRGVCFPGNVYTGYLGPDVFSVDNPTIYYLPGTTGWGKTFDGLPTALLILPVPYNYTTNNGAITITGYTGSGGAVTIPGKIYVSGATNFVPVSSIGDYAFSDCTNLTSVTIGTNVTKIGADAFSGCSSLVSVILPNSVTDLGSHAFFGCTNLLGVFFGSNAPSADSTVFLGDSNALAYSYYFPRPADQGSTLVGIPTGLLPYTYTINNGAINITGYTGSGGAVTIPGTVGGLPITSIGSEAFYQCTNLNSVTIPDGVTNIGHGAFASCSNLATVTIPNSVASIGICAFWNCTSLTGVTLSTNLTELGPSDFDSCTSLTRAAIPNGVLIIRGSAFQNCPGLTNVAVPASVASIGPSAFDSCGSLLAIAVDPQNFYLGSLDGVLVNKSQNAIIQCPGGRSGSYTIPSSIASIGNSGFASCRSITNVTFPNSVTSIGDWAFDSCSGLISITISNSSISIGGYAFESCSSLISVTISSSGLSIGNYAFESCTNLLGVFFLGNGPSPNNSTNIFSGDIHATAYYLPGTTGGNGQGWSTNFDGLPTAPWLPRVQTGDAGFGVQTNQFGFNINWAGGETVVVEACADLANPVWTPLSTNTIAGTLGSGSIHFSDPQWTNYPGRFYRIRGTNAPQQ